MLHPLLITGAVALFLALGGGLLTDVGTWYEKLRKPRLNPPNWLFGPAWTIILALAAWSAATAWVAAPDHEMRVRVVILYGLNAVCHFLWSPLFFKARRPDWALAEVIFLWGSLVAIIVRVAPFSPRAALMVVPYLLWVSFASWLNLAIVQLNRPFPTRENG
jgi:tryptophan-rich sensory protein